MNIGNKIKRLRIQNQLTLEELANRSELTKGFLSQVERNLTSPSIATLNDILEALGTTLRDFFNEKENEKVVFKKEDFFENEQDDYTINYVIPNAQKNEMEPILLKLKSGCSSFKVGPHDGEEFGYVMKCFSNEERYLVKQGETFYVSGGKSHYLKNESSQEATLLWISTPPSF